MTESTPGPAVVLVHGAFADGSTWAPVTERLIAARVPVTAIVNPLRSVAARHVRELEGIAGRFGTVGIVAASLQARTIASS
jgi:hypothetical protein